MEEKVYYLDLDLVQIAQLALIFATIFILVLLRDRLNKNKYGFLLALLLILGVANSYFLKFTHMVLPNFIIPMVLFSGPTLLYHIKEYQIVSYSLRNTYFAHLSVGFIALVLFLLNIATAWEGILIPFTIIHFGCYLVYSLHILSKKKIVLPKDSQHEISLLSLRWRRDFYFLLAIGSVYLMAIFETFFFEIQMLYRYTYVVMFLSVSLLFLYMLWVKAKQIVVFYKNKKESQVIEKYKDSILSQSESKALFVKLETFMTQKQPYLDEELSLQVLASKLKTHQKLLSQCINENFKSNYFDYVNSYRIEQAKKMLLDPFYKDYKVYEIMYEVGFNSRSSFNTAFKKNTGVTPKVFKEQNA